MSQLVIPETVDTASTEGNCLYPPKALGGSPIESPNIKINRQQVKFYTAASPVDNVDGVKVNPLIPAPCQPGIRLLVPQNNTNVFFNQQLPIVLGDKAEMLGTPRPLVGPYGPNTVLIGSRS